MLPEKQKRYGFPFSRYAVLCHPDSALFALGGGGDVGGRVGRGALRVQTGQIKGGAGKGVRLGETPIAVEVKYLARYWLDKWGDNNQKRA